MRFKLTHTNPKVFELTHVTADALNGVPIISVVAYSATQVNITITPVATNAHYFHIERSTDGVTYTEIAIVASGVTTYSDTGRTAGTLYYYRVRAKRWTHYSVYSNVAPATTYSIVAAPAGWDWTLPFDIQKLGRMFQADPAFNIREYADIAVVKTYYLNTVTGSDSADGLTSSTPNKTWNHIIGHGDADRIIIQNGSYLIRSESSLTPARDTEIIGEGTVYFTSDRATNLGAWSLTAGRTNTFQSTVAGGELIASVYDEGTVDVNGNYTRYIERASVDLVEANAGSFLWLAGVLYVHALDGLTPSGRTDMRYYDSSAVYWSRNNVFYFENINFRGGVTLRNASAAGGAKAYFKDCTGHRLVAAGVEEIISQSVTALNTYDDVANYAALNGIETKAIEINCDFGFNGITATNQASTIHDSSRIVRVMGEYHDTVGQNIADVAGGSLTWCLGSQCYKSSALVGSVGLYASGTMWLDCVTSSDNSIDLQNTIGSTIYTRDFEGDGINDINGTLTTY